MKENASLLEMIDGSLAAIGLVCGLLCGFGPPSVQAQGRIDFNMRVSGALVTHVYGPEVSDPSLSKMGNTASETPAGTQTYTGARLEGSGWSAELFAALGTGQPESSLWPVPGSLTTFRTGAVLGGTIAPKDLRVPGIGHAQRGTFQVRVWDNRGGTFNSWSAAEALWQQGSLAAGKSVLFEVTLIDHILGLSPLMDDFRSFNVYFVPEPSATALALLAGAALFVHLRRRCRPP